MKRILLALVFSLVGSSAFAACPATLQVKDNLGVTPNVKYSDDGSGNCIANVVVTSLPGTIALPTGASTSTNQTSILAAIQAPVTLGSASGGWTPKRLSALSTTVVAIKSSAAGQLGLLHCNNPNSSIEYVQVFDVATAGGVTLGTTVPTLSFAVPATNATGYSLPLVGIQFSSGIQVAATTTATGLTAPGTALDCNAASN